MKIFVTCMVGLILGTVSVWPGLVSAQNNKTDSSSTAPANFTADYPKDSAGVLVENSDWTEVPQAFPSKPHVKGGPAASLFGAAVVQYEGLHAEVQLVPGRHVFCICHVTSIPATPTLVRLHAKKNFRELNGGRPPVFGGKINEATKKDLIPAEVSQPEDNVWLVRPREALPPGEYALMLGNQNMSIFPFTVSRPANNSPNPVPDKN
ncbi:MAG TPA: hypothetical protein VH114_07655 [Candidatus Acidoferrum sp.]|jgi:hypothetical protein|nr:hypothetical protein [Candidatus Acidoferrum sp.]